MLGTLKLLFLFMIISMLFSDGLIWLRIKQKPHERSFGTWFGAITMLVGVVVMSVMLTQMPSR